MIAQEENPMTQLAPVIERYLAATNRADGPALVACFDEEAVVTDDGHTMTGIDEIRAWRNALAGQFTYTATVVATDGEPDAPNVRARVEGTFPGSPVELTYHFVVHGDRIARLDIG
jgi:ketosteroid isomerase-like protein